MDLYSLNSFFLQTTLQLTDSRGGRQHLLHLDPKIQFSEPVKQIVGTPGDSKSAFNSGAYTRVSYFNLGNIELEENLKNV